MNSLLKKIFWILLAAAIGGIALHRGESINAFADCIH
jgi:hypothetical protein